MMLITLRWVRLKFPDKLSRSAKETSVEPPSWMLLITTTVPLRESKGAHLDIRPGVIIAVALARTAALKRCVERMSGIGGTISTCARKADSG